MKHFGLMLRVAALSLGMIVAAHTTTAAFAADAVPACVSYADNTAKERISDVNASSRYFSGEYARAFAARFDAIIGGVPGGIADVTSVSAHVHAANGSQSVDVRFYGPNGCDIGRSATLATFLYSAIMQQIGAGA